MLLFVGLSLLMQAELTHAATPLANLQTSLGILKTKLVTLAQALSKINQTYTPVDELSPSQKTYFNILKSFAENSDPRDLAEKMEEYVKKADHEGLKTFIGIVYEQEAVFKIFFANLYNGMLDTGKIITDQAVKNTLPPDQLFQTSDALKAAIQTVIPVGPMTPPRDHGPAGNPSSSTTKTYVDLDAAQQAVYNELNDVWTEAETATPGILLQGKINMLKGLVKKYADPNSNGLEGLKTFAAEKEVNKATYNKDLQNILTHIAKTLAASQQSSNSSSSSGNDSGQTASDPVYDTLEKAWTAFIAPPPGNPMAEMSAKKDLHALMEKYAQTQADQESLKKFIKAHFNEKKTFFNGISKEPLKTIIAEAKP